MVARHNTTEALPRRRGAIQNNDIRRQPRGARFRASISGRRCRFCNGLRTNGCRSGGCDGACRHRPHLPGARGLAAGADARPAGGGADARPADVAPPTRGQRNRASNGRAEWIRHLADENTTPNGGGEEGGGEGGGGEGGGGEGGGGEGGGGEGGGRGGAGTGRVGQSANGEGEGVQDVQDEDYIEPLWKFRSQRSDFDGRADAKAQRKT